MHDDAGEIGYAEIRRKLHAALWRARKNLQVIAGTPKSILLQLGGQ